MHKTGYSINNCLTSTIPVYKQKIWTEGKGVMAPMKKEIISVMEVMVMLTAASAYVLPIL